MKALRNLLQICLLVAIFVPTGLPAQLTWALVNGTATITGYTGNPTVVNIPSTTNGYEVTSIRSSAFQNKYTLTAVTIPDSVITIGASAFSSCRGLTNLSLGSSVALIGSFAFQSCSNLPGASLPDSVTNLGASAFLSCAGLTNVSLGKGLIQIGNNAFSYCFSLTSLAIPAATTSIQVQPFYDCTNLTMITVDSNNPVYSSLAGVLFDKAQTTLLQVPGGRAGSYVIPTNVTTIGSGAVWNCVKLTNVTIPASVTNLPQGPFSGCSTLLAIVVDGQNPSFSSAAGVLFDKAQTTLLQLPGGWAGTYAIPGGVTSIGGLAFSFCNQLTNVIFPGSVSSLGGYAFEDCFGLTSVFFVGNAPANLGTYVFFYDTNATAYYLPGTTGWDSFPALPVAFWLQPNPLILPGSIGPDPQTNGFNFMISWATNLSVVVEAATNPAAPVWVPVQTNSLTGGTSYFSDPQWTNYPSRFYRLRSP